MKSEKSTGVAFAIAAYAIWGVLPIYWKLLLSVPSLEVLSHRVIWSFVFVTCLILLSRQWGEVRKVLADRRQVTYLLFASFMITINWGFFIWAIQNGHVLDSSLGYYINPLIAVLLGVLVFKEKLNRWQLIAIGSALIGVVILVVEFGRFPWVSFVLAITFALYGALKKAIRTASIISLAIETAIILPIALGYVLFRQAGGQGALGGESTAVTLLLLGAGAITAIPLLLFAEGAKRIPLATLGFTQYIAPTLMFILGVFVYHEAFKLVNAISFGFIWLAVLIYSISQSGMLKRSMKISQEG